MNNKQKELFRQQLADQFVHLLEKEKTDWIRGWDAAASDPPINAVTNRQYNGINQFSLIISSMINGYNDPRWATMTQIQDRDHIYHKDRKWHLKAGSHGTKVEYWFPYDTELKKSISWETYKNEIKTGRSDKDFVMYPKYFTVFNASQIEGTSPMVPRQERKNVVVDSLINDLSKAMNVPIHYDGGSSAYYRPATDDIHLPSPEAFHSSVEFAGTALHEMSHATGHPDRLDRDIKNLFGTENYAFEELIAEMSSCFMAANLRDVDLCAFNRFENNEAYLHSWIEAIREKPDALIKAVKQAERASNYMEFKLGIVPEFEGMHRNEMNTYQDSVAFRINTKILLVERNTQNDIEYSICSATGQLIDGGIIQDRSYDSAQIPESIVNQICEENALIGEKKTVDFDYYKDKIVDYPMQKESNKLTLSDLVDKLDTWAKNYDHYDYNDSESYSGYNRKSIETDLKNGKTDAIKNYIAEAISESFDKNFIQESEKLLSQITNFESQKPHAFTQATLKISL